MNLNEIIKTIKDQRITGYELAQKTGLSQVGLDKIIKGQTTKPHKNTIKTLSNYIKSYIKNDNTTNSPTINQQGIGVPYYDVDFMAGFDIMFNDQTVNPDYHINFKPFNEVIDFWVNVSGNSMSQTINSGDIIGLKRIQHWKEFLPLGEIYAIVTDEIRTIKVVKKGKHDDFYKLIPHNPEYEEQEIPKKLITDVFAVKGCMKKFF